MRGRDSVVGVDGAGQGFVNLGALFTVLDTKINTIVLRITLPKRCFKKCPFVPACFCLFNLFDVCVFSTYQRRTPRGVLLLCLTVGVMGVVLSVVLILVCYLTIHRRTGTFLLAFVSFCLLCLVCRA